MGASVGNVATTGMTVRAGLITSGGIEVDLGMAVGGTVGGRVCETAVGWIGGSAGIIVGGRGLAGDVGQAAATAAVMVAPRSGVGWIIGSGAAVVGTNK